MTSSNHAAPAAPRREISRVSVLGAGLMGHAIAYVMAAHGRTVTVFDSAPGALATLEDRLADCARATGGPAVECASTSSLAEAVAGTELVIEAVPEDLLLKVDVLSQAHEISPSALLATNTSVIPIGDIADRLPKTADLIGTHWWNPPHLISIVEVVRGPHAQADSMNRLRDLLTACGKRPVTVADVPGFIGNRLQFALWREAMHIVERGYCDAETVDLIARETFGRRLPAVGPLENADYIGLELTRQIMSYVLPDLSDAASPPAVLEELLADGASGAASGRGFLDWTGERRTAVREQLDAQLRLPAVNRPTSMS